MNEQEAILVLETIKDVYPRYDISRKKATILIKELLLMDYDRVMKKMGNHVATHPYPPTIKEIAAYLEQDNEERNKLEAWRQQAKDVPFSFKQTFHKQMQQLIKEKGK